MTLQSILPELYEAQKEKRAILLVDVVDVPSTEGFCSVLETKGIPGIIGVYGGFFDRPQAHALAAYLRTRAEELSVPVSLMLDHGASLEQCRKAIEWGFSDVMFDGSRLAFAENLVITQQVVKEAHAAGVGVEAELGHVGEGRTYSEYGARRLGFTDPLDAEKFARESGVDFLAVAIGTAHGVYQGEPQIDLDLLAAIRQRVSIPLVLHGGTGLSAEQFRGAIQAGIAKINVATDMFISAGRRVAETAAGGEQGYFTFQEAAQAAFRERGEYYLELFSKPL
jgi:fructose-bisphosphate aldolase class II